jgi:uroporphyrinogen-III synthase
MSRLSDQALPLQHWCVLSLRPRGQHAGLRAAAARAGGRLLALSPQRIVVRDDAATRAALATALAGDAVLFTSPNAVRCAASLHRLRPRRGQAILAVGDGTRRALARLAVAAQAPARMDSEGLLALPALQRVDGLRIGLVTGVGGRDRLVPALQAAGAQMLRADVYARGDQRIPAARWQALATQLASGQRCWLALSSGEALHACLMQCPPTLREGLLALPVIAASPRLAAIAQAAGFGRVMIAASARPAALVQTACEAFG